jgi:hypothetical protein
LRVNLTQPEGSRAQRSAADNRHCNRPVNCLEHKELMRCALWPGRGLHLVPGALLIPERSCGCALGQDGLLSGVAARSFGEFGLGSRHGKGLLVLLAPSPRALSREGAPLTKDRDPTHAVRSGAQTRPFPPPIFPDPLRLIACGHDECVSRPVLKSWTARETPSPSTIWVQATISLGWLPTGSVPRGTFRGGPPRARPSAPCPSGPS